ncbi:D-amino-acid oxidase [Aphelenchoides bicaudatus]|nr:D-amino-acid oxidase [Aphelenchoides bicaudatus]
MSTTRVAIVGQGVIGCSTGLALLEKFPKLNITLYGNCDFKQTCSFGPAGLFRMDKYETRDWARVSFERFAYLERKFGPQTGVKLLSGHIQSDNRELLEGQERNMADIVYNFRWLTNREINLMFPNPSKYCIHYTAYASEGRTYVPWLASQLEELGAHFVRKDFTNLDEVANEGFDFVINCGGVKADKLAGDDQSIQPIRGVIFEVEAPWHKHFNYRDFSTFTIPMSNSVALGTVRQTGNTNMEVTEEDKKEIWQRYLELHPQFKGSKILSDYVALRPERKEIRLEKQSRKTSTGRSYVVIHNYGHGGNGFTLGWGCALDVVKLIEHQLPSDVTSKSKL